MNALLLSSEGLIRKVIVDVMRFRAAFGDKVSFYIAEDDLSLRLGMSFEMPMDNGDIHLVYRIREIPPIYKTNVCVKILDVESLIKFISTYGYIRIQLPEDRTPMVNIEDGIFGMVNLKDQATPVPLDISYVICEGLLPSAAHVPGFASGCGIHRHNQYLAIESQQAPGMNYIIDGITEDTNIETILDILGEKDMSGTAPAPVKRKNPVANQGVEAPEPAPTPSMGEFEGAPDLGSSETTENTAPAETTQAEAPEGVNVGAEFENDAVEEVSAETVDEAVTETEVDEAAEVEETGAEQGFSANESPRPKKLTATDNQVSSVEKKLYGVIDLWKYLHRDSDMDAIEGVKAKVYAFLDEEYGVAAEEEEEAPLLDQLNTALTQVSKIVAAMNVEEPEVQEVEAEVSEETLDAMRLEINREVMRKLSILGTEEYFPDIMAALNNV